METALKAQGDPRMFGQGALFDRYPHSNTAHVNFYERYMKGEKLKAGWVADTDFEKQPID
jgi:N-sulfoglucosamine sulfohydrolase